MLKQASNFYGKPYIWAEVTNNYVTSLYKLLFTSSKNFDLGYSRSYRWLKVSAYVFYA